MDKIRLALYQPDIPQNAGTLLRLSACLSFGVDVIEPCGFLWDERRMRRAGMDYLDLSEARRHESWNTFRGDVRLAGRRLVLLSTKGPERLDHFAFSPADTIMVGRESVGVPDDVADSCHVSVRIPMCQGVRSLNVALAASMAMFEALRQTQSLP